MYGPVQQVLACLAVATGPGGVGRVPQQFKRHGVAVPAQQRDRVVAELVGIGGGAGAQGGYGTGGACGGYFRIIGEQGEPGQLQIQRRIPVRPGARPPQAVNSGPAATAASAACSPG